jgi:hypothetical protein|nr:ATP-binding protein [Thiomicrorhabdus sp.]
MDKEILVGRQLLDVVTSGMYNSPLMIYREYIQNAVDSIDQLLISEAVNNHNEPVIQVNIDGRTRAIVIEDNGAGVPQKNAVNILLSLGLSTKERGSYRGFRGIGRLGGLAYCDRLVFETRAFGENTITEVAWNRLELDALAKESRQVSLEDALYRIISSETRTADQEDPHSFFRVRLENVHSFHSDQIMNVGVVRDYLSQVSPSPFSNNFKSASYLEPLLETIPGYRTYEISVNGKKIDRPYENTVTYSEDRSDQIDEIQDFEIYGVDNEIIAKGWFAKLRYLGSLPANNSMRGIRVRQGNIEIGGEYFLSDCFTERRFTTWQVGEIHVGINTLKANARRDGFEETPNYEKFLEFMTRLGSHLSKACRKASQNRNHHAKAVSSIERVKEGLHKNSIYIDNDHFSAAKTNYLKDLTATKVFIEKHELPSTLSDDVADLVKNIESGESRANFLVDMINSQKFNNQSGKKVFLDFVRGMVKNKGQSSEVDKVLLKSLSDYFKHNIQSDDFKNYTINKAGI